MTNTLTVTLPAGDLSRRIAQLETELENLQKITGILPIPIESILFETNPDDQTNILSWIVVSIPIGFAQNLNTISFSNAPSNVYTVLSAEPYFFDNSLTQINFRHDSTIYDLRANIQSIESSNLIIP